MALLSVSGALVLLLVSNLFLDFPFTIPDRNERKNEDSVLVGAHIPGYQPLSRLGDRF